MEIFDFEDEGRRDLTGPEYVYEEEAEEEEDEEEEEERR